MKVVKIKRFSRHEPTGKYRVFLGNGTAHTFPSHRKAKAFLSRTNKFLTELLHETHQLYMDVWNLYQDNWFYFQHDKRSMNVEFYQNDRHCREYLNTISMKLDYIVDRSSWENGNYFTFTHFKTIFDAHRKVIQVLIVLSKSKSNTEMIYRLRSVYRRLEVLSGDLKGYSVEKTVLLFQLPRNLEETNRTEYVPYLKIA